MYEKRIIDLRSDTVTKPSDAMREAMAKAKVGDDVYGEDPTVNSLEALAATLTGKEAALLVSSGTMGNLIALLCHCGRGEEAIIGSRSHISIHEQAGIAALGGIFPRLVPNEDNGELPLEAIEQALAFSDDIHVSKTGVVCLENTWNGRALDLKYMTRVKALCANHHIPVHLDGARLFNAALASGVKVELLTDLVDTVQFCLSKGLAAPVGSMVCGSEAFIARARRMRKVLGGGMRQAGIIAAAGIYALENMVERLREDHEHARLLANLLLNIDGVALDPESVQSNMVFWNSKRVDLPNRLIEERLKAVGVLCFAEPALGLRMVTHYGISKDDIYNACESTKQLLTGSCQKSCAREH